MPQKHSVCFLLHQTGTPGEQGLRGDRGETWGEGVLLFSQTSVELQLRLWTDKYQSSAHRQEPFITESIIIVIFMNSLQITISIVLKTVHALAISVL